MLELANRIIQITASDSKLVYKPLPTDDPLQRRPDITLAETILKWHPQVNLDDGLNSTINYFKTIVLDTE
jgi:UDP-glucuronate decarboxylase